MAGTPNKASVELKEFARTFTDDAMIELSRLALHASNEAVRVAAIKELLDRGYGKATQLVGNDPDNPISAISRVERVIIDNGVAASA